MDSENQGNELDELMKISRGISQSAKKVDEKQKESSQRREKIQGVQRGLKEISVSVAVNQLNSIATPAITAEVNSLTGKHDNRDLRRLIVNQVHELENRVDNPASSAQKELTLENQVKTLAILIELLFSLE